MVCKIRTLFPAIICASLLAFPALAASVAVRQLPDTKAADRMSRADLLAHKGYYPASCAERTVCTFTGPGGEVWVWEGYARAMLQQGKTLLFRGKCQSACYLAYLEASTSRPRAPQDRSRSRRARCSTTTNPTCCANEERAGKAYRSTGSHSLRLRSAADAGGRRRVLDRCPGTGPVIVLTGRGGSTSHSGCAMA